ncbi:MAG: DUF6624 domain-containing protein, partial [Flavobacteriales bacterium]
QAEAYSECCDGYIQAFKIKEGNANTYYNAACCASLAGNFELALDWLNKTAALGWTNKQWMMNDGDLKALHDVEGWNDVLQAVQANIDIIEKDYDKPLQKRLEAIYVKDQTLRQLISDAEKKFGEDSPEMNYYWGLMAQEDSLNELEVIAIIDEFGWPGKSLVGGKANTAVWLVIQHASLELQEKYLPLMRASVEKGESQGNHLALLEDRIQMYQGKPQVYGSQITKNMETNEWKLHELIEPEYVDQRRAAVGLGPLSEYVMRWNIVFDVPQKVK